MWLVLLEMERRDFLALGFGATGIGVFPRRAYGGDGKLRIERVDSELDHPWENGLYSTLAGLSLSEEVMLPGSDWALKRLEGLQSKGGKVDVKKTKVKVEGAKSKIEVSYVDMGIDASLVIVIPGLTGSSEEGQGAVWMKWLGEQGYSSVLYSSTFTSLMVSSGRYGVPGNLEKEAEFAGKIVKTFIDSRGMRPQMIGTAGRSYGAIQSVLLDKLSQEGKLGFKIDRTQAYSPPISMEETMILLDEKFERAHAIMAKIKEEKGQEAADLYNIINMYLEFVTHNKPKVPMPASFNIEKADLCLGRFFNYALGDSLYAAMTAYPEIVGSVISDEKLKRASEFELEYMKKDYCNAMTYDDFYKKMVVPYWGTREYDRRRILDNGDVRILMAGASEGVDLILTENDPINKEGATRAFEGMKSKGKLTLLKRGGHCGYCLSKWSKAHLKEIFDEHKEPERVPESAPERKKEDDGRKEKIIRDSEKKRDV